MYTINNKGKEEKIGYTLIGNSSLSNKFQVSLTGEGLKKIVKKMKKDDVLRITVFGKDNNGMYKATEFKII